MKCLSLAIDACCRKAVLAIAHISWALIPLTASAQKASTNLETMTIGGGCFWCGEAVFQRIPGVASVVSGFAGVTTPNPSYDEVCTGSTGHSQVIQLIGDPAII